MKQSERKRVEENKVKQLVKCGRQKVDGSKIKL